MCWGRCEEAVLFLLGSFASRSCPGCKQIAAEEVPRASWCWGCAGTCSCGCLEHGQGGSRGTHQHGAECQGRGWAPWSGPCLESSIASQPHPRWCWGAPRKWVEAPAGITLRRGRLLALYLFLHHGLGGAHPSWSTRLSHHAHPPTVPKGQLPQTFTRMIVGRRLLRGSEACAGCMQSDGTP